MLKIENSEDAINQLCLQLQKKKRQVMVVREVLKKQMKSIDSLLVQMLSKDTVNQRKIEILLSVKGVGKVTILTLIAELPELGKLNRGEVA